MDVEALVETISRDPLYVLSTAGQELFHSNFLAWLIENHPERCDPLWELFGMSVPSHGGIDPFVATVKREWRHIDLVVDTGMTGHRLVLENKLHSLPSTEQLDRYAADKQVVPNPVGVKCVLLSLLPPIGEVPTPWRYVPYADYGRAVAACATGMEDHFGKELTVRYAALVDALVRLVAEVDPESHRADPFHLTKPQRDAFQHARLLPLVEKLRATRLAQATTREVGVAAGATFGAGFSNGQSLVEHFITGPKGRMFGWQLQGEHMRLAVMTGKRDPRARDQREAVVEQEHIDFFNFDFPGVDRQILAEGNSRKPWLGYEPNFVYRYQLVSNQATFEGVVQLTSAATAWTNHYVSHLPLR